jgi:hypothetical protein
MEGDILMNSELHLKNVDLKYWINELPILEKIESKTKKTQIPARENIRKKCFWTKVALEVYLHKNAGNYALLGLEYEPNESGFLNIDIQYVVDNEKHYDSDLTKFNNYKYLGLPEECTDMILETIKSNKSFSSGTLKIPIAANCEVGSSPLVFSKVTSLLLELICNQNEDNNIDLLMEELYTKYFLT